MNSMILLNYDFHIILSSEILTSMIRNVNMDIIYIIILWIIILFIHIFYFFISWFFIHSQIYWKCYILFNVLVS